MKLTLVFWFTEKEKKKQINEKCQMVLIRNMTKPKSKK